MKAFRTGWSQVSGEERRKILYRVADAIEARADEIALVECVDTGQPIRYMSKAALRGAGAVNSMLSAIVIAPSPGTCRAMADRRRCQPSVLPLSLMPFRISCNRSARRNPSWSGIQSAA